MLHVSAASSASEPEVIDRRPAAKPRRSYRRSRGSTACIPHGVWPTGDPGSWNYRPISRNRMGRPRVRPRTSCDGRHPGSWMPRRLHGRRGRNGLRCTESESTRPAMAATIGSMHDRGVRGSSRYPASRAKSPGESSGPGVPKRIVDRVQSKDRARVGGVNRPIPVVSTVFRARKGVLADTNTRNREARVQGQFGEVHGWQKSIGRILTGPEMARPSLPGIGPSLTRQPRKVG